MTQEARELVRRLTAEAEDIRLAPVGERMHDTLHARNWDDKPHRVAYDAAALIEEAATTITTLLDKLAAAERQNARLTDPAYLTTAIEKVGMVDAEWKARADKLAAALEPFVVGDAAMEEILWGHLPDDATGTVTVKLADFRRARSALAEKGVAKNG